MFGDGNHQSRHVRKHAEQVRAYLEANLTQDLDMNAVARAASLSPFYLTRIFKQRYGVPPYRYLIELRIRYASELLRESSLSVTQVCHRSGFNSLSHFITTVAVGPMLYELVDQPLPLCVIPRRRDVAFPPEDRFLTAREPLWHEAKLDKRAHACAEYRIVDGIDVLEVVDRASLLVFGVDAELVLQKPVHAKVLKTALPVHDVEIALPAGAQSLRNAPCADDALSKLITCSFDAPVVDRDHARRSGLRQYGSSRNEQQHCTAKLFRQHLCYLSSSTTTDFAGMLKLNCEP